MPGLSSTKKKNKKTKQRALKQADAHEHNDTTIPRSIVLKRGKVGASIIQLVSDLRRVMSPYTALQLKENKKNTLKDFLHVASSLHVSHLMLLSQTPLSTSLRLLRIPRGPTFTFRIQSYSLIRDIIHIQKKPHSPSFEYLHSPLVVLNNFSGRAVEAAIAAQQANPSTTQSKIIHETQIKLLSTMFQSMFPSIEVDTVSLHDCRRVVLFHYDPVHQTIEFRHYLITCKPVGISKSVKRLIRAEIPNLGNLTDISEYVYRDDLASDSEAEDTPENRITLESNVVGRGNRKSNQSAIRLKELGPRLCLKVLKIEEGFNDGKVLYHYSKNKTTEEVEALAKLKKQREAEKEKRRKEQAANVKRKQRDSGEQGNHRSFLAAVFFCVFICIFTQSFYLLCFASITFVFCCSI